MKNILTLLLSLFILSATAQQLDFEVKGSALNPIKKDLLRYAKTLKEIRYNYPASWISDYVSVEIQATHNGNVLSATGANDILSAEQRELLASVEVGTDLQFDVYHHYTNPVTKVQELRHIEFSYTVVPKTEAIYLAGEDALNGFLKEKAIANISPEIRKSFDQAIVTFVVDETGAVNNVAIKKSSGDTKTDKLLVQTVKQLSDWKPAQDEAGLPVKQTFQLRVGHPGC